MKQEKKEMTFAEFIDRVVEIYKVDRKSYIHVRDRQGMPYSIEVEAIITFIKNFDNENQFRTLRIISAINFAKMPLTQLLRQVAIEMVSMKKE